MAKLSLVFPPTGTQFGYVDALGINILEESKMECRGSYCCVGARLRPFKKLLNVKEAEIVLMSVKGEPSASATEVDDQDYDAYKKK